MSDEKNTDFNETVKSLWAGSLKAEADDIRQKERDKREQIIQHRLHQLLDGNEILDD
jgi:hypothetical protein